MAAHQDDCLICAKIERCRTGIYPALIAELDTGYAVMGDHQFLPGYSMLLCKQPATELHELAPSISQTFLLEMSQLAEAVARATNPYKLNYECLGNVAHHLHWHIFPRYLSEPELKPVWQVFPRDEDLAGFEYAEERDGKLRRDIAAQLAAIRISTAT